MSVLPSKSEASSLSAMSLSALVRSWAMPVSISSVKLVVRSSCWLSTWATRCESEPFIVSIILTEAASASGTGTPYSPMRA